jgi:hypothetical protein
MVVLLKMPFFLPITEDIARWQAHEATRAGGVADLPLVAAIVGVFHTTIGFLCGIPFIPIQ